MKTLIILSVLLLTGCASQCKHSCIMGWGPGSPSFNAVADYYDNRDPCQYKGKPAGYKLADFCFANSGKKVYHVVDNNGKIVYKVE